MIKHVKKIAAVTMVILTLASIGALIYLERSIDIGDTFVAAGVCAIFSMAMYTIVCIVHAVKDN